MEGAVYPGSFDPVTNGHLDIIERGVKMFGRLNIVVMVNHRKTYAFTLEERMDMLKEAMEGKWYAESVIVDHWEGLSVDYCEKVGIHTIMRGVRAMTDFDAEFQMAITNRELNHKVESVLMVTNVIYSYVSSSGVKEIAYFKGDTSYMVPPNVQKALKERYGGKGD
ncbi:MAG: pantetheine-phosphate adenylyltransferase [Eubacteriaceae bacterium]|nr:pantetheine-phosphate adenylyltransferase [Eubacteriaceae bacterium]